MLPQLEDFLSFFCAHTSSMPFMDQWLFQPINFLGSNSLTVGDFTSTKNEEILLYISSCKPHFISWFYEVKLGLKSTS